MALASPDTTIGIAGRSPSRDRYEPDPNSLTKCNNTIYLSCVGAYLNGAADPHPHTRQGFSALVGAIHRYCRRPPYASQASLRPLRRHTHGFMRHNFKPVSREILGFYEWLLATPYSNTQKAVLVQLFEFLCPGRYWRVLTILGPVISGGVSFDDLCTGIDRVPQFGAKLRHLIRDDPQRSRDLTVKSFIKEECYPCFKLPRPINGRDNLSKIIFGPIIKTVENVIYKHRSFIKTVPLADRPSYITDLVSGPGTYCATDHTSFESSFTVGLCCAVEYEVYSFLLNPSVADYICKSFYSINTCIFKFFRSSCAAKRMSGDMNTSLGNGITNLITIHFLYYRKYGFNLQAIVVEGDDSLFRQNVGHQLTTQDFATLGLVTKIEIHSRLSTASFCGNIFDERDLKNMVDPGRILRRVGYIDNKYKDSRHSKKMGLFRAYGFSMYYQYHGCPIVEALAMYVLRVTRGFYANMSSINIHKFAAGEVVPSSEERMYDLFPPYEIGLGSREIVNDLFGYSYDDQVYIEDYFNALDKVQPFDLPIVLSNSHPDTITYFRECSAYEGDEYKFMHPPPSYPFRKLVSDLTIRLKHLEQRHKNTTRAGLSPGSEMPGACECGSICLYWDDLLINLREDLGLKPTPKAPHNDEPVRQSDLEFFESYMGKPFAEFTS